MTSELKPCPFCLKTKHLKTVALYTREFDGYYGFNVICDASGFEGHERGCGSAGAWGETEQSAATVWNTRAVPDVPELVTAGYQHLIQRTGRWDNMPSDWSAEENKAYQDKNHVTRELVTKDQAVAVIASKDQKLADAELAHITLIDVKNGIIEAMARNLLVFSRDTSSKITDLEAKLADYENQVPVAYLNSHPIGGKDYSHINKHDRLSAANKEAGWTETLLYTAPIASDADLRAKLSDPTAVLINMMRGEIAKPEFDSLQRLYPEIADLRAENEDLRKAVEQIAKQKLVSEIPLDDYENAAFEDAHDMMIEISRKALNPSEPRT